MRGHGASGSLPSGSSEDGPYGWERFGLDVLDTLAELGLTAGSDRSGVVGVGHSAGGSALFLAEELEPGSLSRIWAWEPIMNSPGRDERARRGAELAKRARQRRAEFSTIEEAREHFQGRGVFAEFSPEAFEAFLDGGLVPTGHGGYKLACDPEAEARMYEGAASHDAWGGLGRVLCPVRLVGGERSPAVPPDELAAIATQLPVPAPSPGPVPTTEVPAPATTVLPLLGHFGPFESPADIAADIAKWAS
jgi:pimeloyl-ACP methyl ester carboxylesterase